MSKNPGYGQVHDDDGATKKPLLDQDNEIEEDNSKLLLKDAKTDGTEQKKYGSPVDLDKEQTMQRPRTESAGSDGPEIDTQAPRRVFEINTVFRQDQLDRRFMSNRVVTTKYNCFTFLPKNLFVQFSKMANAYFLFMALLQLVPGLYDFYGSITTFMPLMGVVAVSMIKDAYEDNIRGKQDNEENKMLCQCAPRGTRALLQTKSEKIQVGCIVKVTENQFFPCDMLMLSSSLPKGVAYVETKNLDGETNLKIKQAAKAVEPLARTEEIALENFNGAQIDCEGPNVFLYKFEGNLKLPDGTLVPIDPDQILLRGSCLRNTEWIIGVCVYSGHETKIMKNGAKGRAKTSKIANLTNVYILVTMLIQFSLSLIAAVVTSLWTWFKGDEYWYIYPLEGADDMSLAPLIAQQTGIWFIALMNFVPISLLVTLEMINFFQAYFIANDIEICDQATGLQASVQSSNLNEELGMVHYIFSDKTGTLTQNVMEFKRFSAGAYEYGCDDPEPAVYPPGVTNVNFDDSKFTTHIEDPNHENNTSLKAFLEALGLCHTVVSDVKKDKQGKSYVAYNASSPDELALVNGARHLGFFFERRDEDNNLLCETWDGPRKYKLLNLIEFDSTRKRMTVVLRTPENKILVICKGADSIIEKRLKSGQKLLRTTQGYLDAYAKTGLRTLLIASKTLSEETYQAWQKKYQVASTSLNKEKAINNVAEELEVEFDLVGSTAIEDKLQEDVGKTIFDIKRAGVQVWVLTGDKVETAINIGHSCELLHMQMNMFILEETNPKKVRIEITEAKGNQNLTKQARDNAVIVAGDTLTAIQSDEVIQKEFIDLCEGANVVLACRVSPKQKAEIVHMIRERNPDKTTLAIGDGANDVNMITAAHIGIGIAGLEGQQAVRASDYAIGQFRFLRNLLFFHGREAYRRNSYAIGYMFYKNVLETVPVYMFGCLSLFSGSDIYNSLLYMIFNLCFTALPVIWFATMDYEYSKHVIIRRPRLYRIGLENVYFSKWVFWRWIFYAFWQSSLILFLGFYTLESSPNIDGKYGGIYASGNFVFGTLVIVANMKILISSFLISGWLLFFVLGSTVFYVFCYWFLSVGLTQGNDYGTLTMLLQAPQMYLTLMLFTFMFVLVDTGLQYLNMYINRWFTIQKDRAEKAQRQKDRSSQTTIKRQLSKYDNRGFAFSQEKGNDKLVTESLSSRVGQALLQRIQNQAIVPLSHLEMSADQEFEPERIDGQRINSSQYSVESMSDSQRNLLSPTNQPPLQKDLNLLAEQQMNEARISKITERPESESESLIIRAQEE